MAIKPQNSDILHASNVIAAEFGTNHDQIDKAMKFDYAANELATRALAGDLSPQAGNAVANAEAIAAQQSSEKGV